MRRTWAAGAKRRAGTARTPWGTWRAWAAGAKRRAGTARMSWGTWRDRAAGSHRAARAAGRNRPAGTKRRTWCTWSGWASRLSAKQYICVVYRTGTYFAGKRQPSAYYGYTGYHTKYLCWQRLLHRTDSRLLCRQFLYIHRNEKAWLYLILLKLSGPSTVPDIGSIY